MTHDFQHPDSPSRRAFLRRTAQLAMVGGATPLGLNLAALGEAAAFTATDYKALVCVFLYGGNDYANTVVTYDDPSYNAYRSIRTAGTGPAGLAIDKSALAATVIDPTTALAGGRRYALHPSMTGLANLFGSGRAAAVLNVGPLVKPTSRNDFFSSDRVAHPLPPQLFSHNDQQSVWQAQKAEGATVGWGGAIGDMAMGNNGNSLFTCISATGNGVFVAGQSAVQYQMSTVGAVPVRATREVYWTGDDAARAAAGAAFRTLITKSRGHVLENEYAKVLKRSIDAEGQISTALAGTSLATPFPANNSLADQLKIVARTIAARNTLGNKRQVFLVSLGGFDLHDNLIELQPTLLGKVSAAMTAFYNATVEMGIADKVTSFTASDFGRTLTSNGNGADHGWGGHHLVVGGAVRGKAIYGTPPPVSIGFSSAPEDQWHIGQGRLLPSTSVDQYAATMARWFGVSAMELSSILPNLDNFGSAAGHPEYPSDLGFMT